ncbi:MAG: hypothetical protein K1X91_17100 [Bacteriodetes bacterium]|nr:hypothetical protein [Bacteroidota bacterium]
MSDEDSEALPCGEDLGGVGVYDVCLRYFFVIVDLTLTLSEGEGVDVFWFTIE